MDKRIEKANQLVSLLREAKQIIDSLSKEKGLAIEKCLTVNERRKIFGLAPIPGGDVLLIQKDRDEIVRKGGVISDV